MEGYNNILRKLNEFTKKYYIKKLIKGSLLFLSLGMLFFLAVMSLEYMFWLNQNWRLILFLVFVLVELYLLYHFILIPIFYLFRVKKGLSNKEAARLVGRHFPKIDDKLYNLLELSENTEKSELLLASIEQKSNKLSSFSFAKAIDYKESVAYAKYVIIPVAIVALIWLSGNIASFFSSYTRVVNYDLAYEQPAPFSFRVLNDSLEVLDNESLTIRADIVGDVQPENVYIVVEGELLLLQKQGNLFVHTFVAPVRESSFYLTANGWDSKLYTVKSYSTPSLIDFKMELDYPGYTQRSGEVISGSGNAVIPEGTGVTWKIEGVHVDEINMSIGDSLRTLAKEGSSFIKRMNVYNNLSYELSTSNANVKNFERLGYRLDVVKDAHPKVEVEQILDSVNLNQSFFTGQASDDFKVNEIRVVCFPVDDRKSVQKVVLETPKSNVHQFYYTFPSGLRLLEGTNYRLFFEVVDNDGLRGGKVTRSNEFSTALYNDNQLKNRELEFQNSLLDNLDKSLARYKEQQEELSKINDKQKEGNSLNFEDKSEIRNFLRKQEHQEQLMEKFSRQLKESLNKDEVSDEIKKMLQERLERQELEARKNERLLEELNKLSDKINKGELKKKLEEIGKNQQTRTRSLEQILELTKRYYVTEKMNQLAQELDKLAERQELLSRMKLDEYTDDKLQREENEKFDELSRELDTLRKDNENLKKPFEMDVSAKQQESVKKDQKDALEEINKHQGNEESSESGQSQETANKVTQKQKSAAQKMREMSSSMQQSAMGGGDSSDTEDAEMLRQILDNLVTFSFKQENLFESVESADVEISQFAKTVKDQKELRRLFEHVDDSLFALSLRRVELSEFVNEQITEVYYNIDKSLESIADNQVFQGASYQQYVINATNSLADFLANILDNMQESMKPGQGSGQGGSDFQLPDIIQGQQSIGEKMKGSSEGEGKEPGTSEKKGVGDEGRQEGGDKKGNQGNEESKEQSGKQGEGGNGEGNARDGDEMGLNEIYEIYKEQQSLRRELEKQLKDMINNSDRNLAKKLVRQMEDFENDLLENGITQRTRSKANSIQHQLLKLENASLKQGERKERESNTNQIKFLNPITTKPEALKNHRNDVEILNRQALPLRQNYDEKVKVYFKND